jgi:hypothetical protein
MTTETSCALHAFGSSMTKEPSKLRDAYASPIRNAAMNAFRLRRGYGAHACAMYPMRE